MRIGTYNVYGFKGYPVETARAALGAAAGDGTARHFESALAELGCDVLCVQEGTEEAFARRLADALSRRLVTYPSPLRWPGHLLSRWPVIDARTYSGRGPDAEGRPFSRMAGAAMLEPSASRRLWVCNVHLHPKSAEIRRAEAAMLAAHVAELAADRAPVVVAGDFNCETDEAPHRRLAELGFVNVFAAAGRSCAATRAPGSSPALAVDHIYVSEGLAGAVCSAEIVGRGRFVLDPSDGEHAWATSDHWPVVAELELG